MTATTSDRIRQCAAVGLDVTDLIMAAVEYREAFGSVSPGIANQILDRIQNLWDAAYEAGRADGAAQ